VSEANVEVEVSWAEGAPEGDEVPSFLQLKNDFRMESIQMQDCVGDTKVDPLAPPLRLARLARQSITRRPTSPPARATLPPVTRAWE